MPKGSLLVLLVILCLAGLVVAQETGGTITGTVTDESGAVMPDATVTVTNTDTGVVVRSLQTNKTGNYTASRIPIGHYMVTAEKAEFQKTAVKNIEVNVADSIKVDLKMRVGASTNTVEVAADAQEIQTQEANNGTLVSGSQIRELSLNNRNYEQFVAMVPGVSFGGSDQLYIGTTNPSGQTNTVSFAINGNRTSANLWTVDGADNVDRGSNLTLLNYPSIDAIAELKVLRNIYSAEYGRAAAGNVNVVTKSGAKDYHGDAYEFIRNDVFNANRYENNFRNIKRPPLRYNNFGYTFGGPVGIPGVWVPKDPKTFFFWSQEWRKQSVPGSFTALVPTAAEKQGIFSRTVCVAPNTYLAACPAGSTGNSVVINPVAQQYINAIWSQMPEPNDTVPGTHQFFGTRQSKFDHRQELIRLDHNFSPKWQVMFRFLNDTIPTLEPGGLFTNALLPGVANTSTDSPGRSYVAKTTNTFGNTWLMEAGYAKSNGAIISRITGLIGDVGSVSQPLAFASTLNRLPSLTYTNGASSVAGFGPYDDFNRNHNVFANVSKVWNNHTFKFGTNYNHYQKTENASGNNAGTFNFNANGAVVTGLTTAQAADARFQQAWANFLVGDVTTYTQVSLDLTPDIQLNQFEWYFQDDWKVRPNLTFNLGLRHSIYRQPVDKNHLLTTFDPTLFDPAHAPVVSPTTGLITSCVAPCDPLNGISINGSTSPHGQKIAGDSNWNFAPRVGFAWDIFGNAKTALRGGYGIAYDSTLVGILEQDIFANPPFLQSVSISNTRLENPTAASPTISASPIALRGSPYQSDVPYVQSYSLDLQQAMPFNTIFAVGYYGNLGRHLLGIVDLNQPIPGKLVICGGIPITAPAVCAATATTPAATGGAAINSIRPYQGYGPINTVLPIMTSNYNSLQTSLQKKFKGKSQVSFNYTWSKALTTAQTDRSSAPQNVYCIHCDYGPAQLDRRHIFNTNFVYELPFFSSQEGVLGHILGGWETSGIAYLYSGLPLTVTSSGVDPAGQGYNISTSSVSGRPDLVGNPIGPRGTDLSTVGPTWFNTGAFASVCPSVGLCLNPRPGTSGRGVVYGPGFSRLDLSLFKNIKVTERVNMQFRTEAYNVFNHTNPSGVGTTFGLATFGHITSYRDPREMQFGLKLMF
jgi:hypothetical protein